MPDEKIPVTTFGLKPEKLINLLRLAEPDESDAKSGHMAQDLRTDHDSDVDTADYQLGEQIGPYKLVSVLGEGGLGIVYLAEQEKPLRRQVALKIIKPGMDSKQVIARFESERQALALLDHENIAKVFDAGTTVNGCPYFAMEYINGVTITEYCDKEKICIDERLKLFIQICEAIQHAHHKGIIHRDIKSSNILVAIHDKKPVPKVIDFGISKAINQPLTERTLVTERGKLIGTPEYMSPEQADIANLNIDTRSDIYSLGVLLYVLLTGVLPFDQKRLRNSPFSDIQKIIREEIPPRPSTRLSGLGENAFTVAENRSSELASLSHRLRKELEWIPLKALRKEPSRRYRSAAEFADDIRNYLNGKPLIAGPESKVYKVTKFIHRNRPFVFSAAVVLFVLAAGAVISTLFAIGQSRARTKAVIAERIARLESEQAKKAQNYAERLAYYGAIQTVAAKVANNDFSTVRATLEETDPQRRGWEWGYLMQMCRLPDWSLQAYPAAISMLQISQDGQYILTAGALSITLRDNAAKSKWEAAFGPHPRWPGYAAFAPQNTFVAVIINGGLYAYDLQSGKVIYQSSPLGFCSLCIHPHENTLYAGTSDGTLFVFDTTNWTVKNSRKFAEGRIWHLAIGSKGDRLAIAAGNRTGELTFICNSSDLRTLYTFKPWEQNNIRGLAILDNLNLLLVVEKTLTHVCSLDDGEKIARLDGHNQDVFAIAPSSDETKVVTASIDGQVNVYDTNNWNIGLNQPFTKLKTQPESIKPTATIYHGSAVYYAAIYPDGTVLSAAVDGTLKKWSNPYTSEIRSTIKIPPCDSKGPYSLDFRQDGRKLAYTGWWQCNQVILFDIPAKKTEYINVQGFNDLPDSRWVRFRPKSNELAVQTSGGLRFFDTETRDNPQIRYLPMREELTDFAFDSSGKIIAVSYISGGVQLLDIETGLPSAIKLEQEAVEACRLAFSADCTALTAIGQTRRPSNVYVWDLPTGRLRSHFKPPYGDTKKSAIAFHPQGRLIASGQNNGQIALWDTENGELMRLLVGHGEGPVNSLEFSPDGLRLLSGGTDRTVRVWDWHLDRPLLTINQEWYALSARFSPDGLAIANTDLYPVGAWIRTSVPLDN